MNTTALFSKLLLGWLVDYYLLATLLLLAVCLPWRWIRQPAHRITAAWIVMIELLALAVVCALPFWPRISLMAESTPKAAPLAIVREQSQPVMPQRPLLPVETMRPLVESSTIEKASLPAAPPAPPAIPWTWQEKVSAGYGAAAALIILWLGWGAVAAWRICRKAKPAAASLTAELSAVIGDRPSPRLLVSPRIANAVALGVFRPTIVLPVAMAEKGPSPTLRAVLAHECAHVRHRDLWLLSLGRCLLPLLFAHPLFWWLRRAIRSDQELLADAFAAGEQRQNYAEELLRLIRNAARPPMTVSTAVGLWEGSSQISRRIAMLLDETFRIHPTGSRRWKFQALGLLLVFGGACSLLTLQPARSAEDPKQPPAAEKNSATGEKSSSIKPGVTTVNSGTLVITGTNTSEENEHKDVLILPGYEILARPQVVRELNLTDEQMSKLHEIQQTFIAEESKHAKDAQKANEKLPQAELDAALKKRIQDRKADIRKQVEAVLTSEQWQKIEEIVFQGKVFSWCLHVTELKKIGINDLTKEQLDELRLLQTKHGENLSKQSQTAKEKILSHLSPEQRAKAREAALGPEGFVGSGGGVVNIEGENYLVPTSGPYPDFSWPQVQQELGLTADQKKQVRDILGGSVNLYARLQDEVPKLSAEEKKMSLLSNASSSDTSVTIATKPTDSPEERKKQEAERLEMLKKDIARRRTEWESKPLVKLGVNLRKQFEAVLTPEQLEKYKEMAFQKVFDFQLSSPPIMEKLGLSEEQRTAIQKIEVEKIEESQRFSGEVGANILKVLTPAQQAKLREAIRRQEAETSTGGGNDEDSRNKSGIITTISPSYAVEPPDILSLEIPKLQPLPGVKFMHLWITIGQGTLLDKIITNQETEINLGPGHGTVSISGMAGEEIKAKIEQKILEVPSTGKVTVQLTDCAPQPVTGQYLVAPNNTINLSVYGVVKVGGMNVAGIKMAVEKQLAKFFNSPEVTVKVLGHNSKPQAKTENAASINYSSSSVHIARTENTSEPDMVGNVEVVNENNSTTLRGASTQLTNKAKQQPQSDPSKTARDPDVPRASRNAPVAPARNSAPPAARRIARTSIELPYTRYRLLYYQGVFKVLNITDEQTAKLRKVQTDFLTDKQKSQKEQLELSEEEKFAAEQRWDSNRLNETEKLMEEILTPEQSKTLEDLNRCDEEIPKLGGSIAFPEEGIEVHLDRCEISDAMMDILKRLPPLKIIFLSLGPESIATGLNFIDGLANLQSLHVSGKLNDAGLKHLQNLKKLQQLEILDADLTSLENLKGLNDLRRLIIYHSPFTGAGLENFPNLDILDVRYNQVTGAALEGLQGMNQLELLFLEQNKINDAGLKYLLGLKKLRILELSSNEITDAGVELLEKMTQLEGLGLKRTKITDDGLKRLQGLKNLHVLGLSYNEITDAGLGFLSKMDQLWDLGLANTQITDAGLKHLERLNLLQHISLEGTKVTAAGANALQQALPKCNIQLMPLTPGPYAAPTANSSPGETVKPQVP